MRNSDAYTHEIWRMEHGYSTKDCPCTSCRDERAAIAVRRKSTDMQTLSDAAGLNLLPRGVRIGHTARDQALAHIDEMEQGGFIDATEADKRRQYVDQAKTNAEILALTSDLPAPPDRRPLLTRAVSKYDFDKLTYAIPTLLTAMILFIGLAVMPTAVAGNDHWFSTVHGLWECIASIVVGSAGAITSFVWLINKSIDD